MWPAGICGFSPWAERSQSDVLRHKYERYCFGKRAQTAYVEKSKKKPCISPSTVIRYILHLQGTVASLGCEF